MSSRAFRWFVSGACFLALACASSAPPPSHATKPAALPGAFTPQQLAAQWKLEHEAQERRIAEQARLRAEEDAKRNAEAEYDARQAEAAAARAEAARDAQRVADEKRLQKRLKEIEHEHESRARSGAPVEYVRPSGDDDTSESRECCKICHKGCACGDSCISCDETCYLGIGCACDG